MADDQQNPFTMMGMLSMMQPNKYISPQFRDQPLQLPGYYGGPTGPTDALGRPIQSYQDAQAQHDAWDAAHPAPAQGTTLNTTGQGLEAKGSQARAMQDAGYGDWALLDPMMAQSNRPGATADPGTVGATRGWNPANPASVYPTTRGGILSGGQQAAPAAPQTNPVNMRQAYLDALASPGKVTTPGATVPQSAPLGQPSVLDAFLQTHSAGPAAPAGGGYSNAGFFDTLNKLRSA